MTIPYAPLSKIFERIRSKSPSPEEVVRICCEEYGVQQQDLSFNRDVLYEKEPLAHREALDVITFLLYRKSPGSIYTLSGLDIGNMTGNSNMRIYRRLYRLENISKVLRRYGACPIEKLQFVKKGRKYESMRQTREYKRIVLGTLEKAKHSLLLFKEKYDSDHQDENKNQSYYNQFLQIVCDSSQFSGKRIEISHILKKNPKEPARTIKLIAYKLLIETDCLSFRETGRILGHADHTSVRHGYEALENLINSPDAGISKSIEQCKRAEKSKKSKVAGKRKSRSAEKTAEIKEFATKKTKEQPSQTSTIGVKYKLPEIDQLHPFLAVKELYTILTAYTSGHNKSASYETRLSLVADAKQFLEELTYTFESRGEMHSDSETIISLDNKEINKPASDVYRENCARFFRARDDVLLPILKELERKVS